jgi:hypothetical protein
MQREGDHSGRPLYKFTHLCEKEENYVHPLPNEITNSMERVILQDSITKDIRFIRKAIKDFLNYNNYSQKSVRLKLVQYLLEPEYKEKYRFRDIKPPTKKETNQFDDCFVGKSIENYKDNYHSICILEKIPNQFFKMLDDISSYLVAKNQKEFDDGLVVLTEYKQNVRDKWRLIFPEKVLPEDATTEDLEQYDLDSLFKELPEMTKWFMDATKKGKKKWNQIKKLKVNLEDMDETQRQMYDTVQYIKQLLGNESLTVSRKKLLYSIVNNLVDSINRIHQYSTPKNKRQRSVTASRDEYDGSDLQYKTIMTIDYTNPKHIAGLLENYFDLHNKYKNDPDSMIFAVLQDFKAAIDAIKIQKVFKDEKHLHIIDAFMSVSSDKKEVAKHLKMNTEKMMRTVKTCISPKIAKFFENHVGK